MCPEVHRSGIVPEEERLALLVGFVNEAQGLIGYLVVDRLHTFLRQGTGILNPLSAFAIGPAVKHASGSKPLPEFRVLRIINILRLLLGIQMIQIAKELVEAVKRGEELVLVSQMVLAKLAGHVTQRLE